jgi:hypothetical protein
LFTPSPAGNEKGQKQIVPLLPRPRRGDAGLQKQSENISLLFKRVWDTSQQAKIIVTPTGENGDFAEVAIHFLCLLFFR